MGEYLAVGILDGDQRTLCVGVGSGGAVHTVGLVGLHVFDNKLSLGAGGTLLPGRGAEDELDVGLEQRLGVDAADSTVAVALAGHRESCYVVFWLFLYRFTKAIRT